MIVPRANQIIQNRQTTSGRMETSGTQTATGIGSMAIGLVQKHIQEKDEAQYQEAVNTALKKKNEWKAANLSREGKAAEGLTEDFLSFNKEVEEELGGKLSNNAKAKFNQWQVRDTEQDKLGVMMHQRKQDQFVKQSAFQEGLGIAQESIRLDAKGNRMKAFEHAELTLQNGLNSGVIPQEQYETKRMEVMNGLRTETAKSYYMQDKHDFMKSGINELGFGETEKAYWQDKYANDLEADKREKKALYSEEYRQIMSSVDDMDAQATRNKTTVHYHENAKKLVNMGYNEAAKELYQRASVYDKVNVHIDKTRNMSLSEEGEVIKGLKLPEGLDGSSVENKAQMAIAKEYETKVKIFKADSAEFVAAFAVGSSDEERVSSRISLQEKQGVPIEGGPRALRNVERDTFRATWDTAPDDKARVELVNETMKYGKFTPKVLSEIGVNQSLSLVSLLDTDDDIKTLVSGVSFDKTMDKKKDNPLIVGDFKKSDFSNQNKSSEFYQLLSDVQATLPNSGLKAKIADVEKAMTGISTNKVDPKAGPEFFNEKFSVINSGDKKVYFRKGLDEDEIEDALDARKDQIMSKYGSGSAIHKMALRDAVWVNTQTGYALVDTKKGMALEFPEAEIDGLELDPVRKEKVRRTKAMSQQQVAENFVERR